jgi:hypothetical protein
VNPIPPKEKKERKKETRYGRESIGGSATSYGFLLLLASLVSRRRAYNT